MLFKNLIFLKEIRANNNAENNLRKHLGSKSHNLEQHLFKSQKSKSKSKDQNQNQIPSQRVKELDEALVNCIIEDARPFGDFSKPGMVKFLNVASRY